MRASAQDRPFSPELQPAITVCPACNATNQSEIVKIPDHEYGLTEVARFAKCAGCGTLFQFPMPDGTSLARFYPSDYHSMTHAGFLSRIRNGMRLRRLRKLSRENGPILDFGCGDGAFLERASETIRDRQLWGFEIAQRRSVKEVNGGAVKIVGGELRDLLEILPPCRLITMNHVIEHLPDPAATTSELVKRLLPGGIFEGQTPAADSLEHEVFGEKWSGYHAPRHTVVFSRSGLSTMLKGCGLSSPVIEGGFNPAGIAVSLGSLGHRNGGRINRSEVKWLGLVAAATLLAPIDLLSGQAGIMNFAAERKPE